VAISVGSFNFSSFTSKVGMCSTEHTFLVSFFVMFHVVFYFVIRYYYKSTVVLLLSFFYNFSISISQYFIYFAFGSLLFLVNTYKLLMCLQDIFVPCVIQSFMSFTLLCSTGKLAWKMLKKVHRNELNIKLGSLST
jgi:hypothetical protein